MSTSYRPPGRWDDGPPPNSGNLREMYHFRGSNQNAPGRDAGFRPRRGGNHHHRRPGISERPLLRVRQSSVETPMFKDPNAKDKFRNPNELTDSEEDEMVLSDNETTGMPAAKRAKIESLEANSATSTLKWSNPDPYTSLPPPTETTGKRTDVVKLIRKAKINDEKKDDEGVAQAEDFISFDIGVDELFPSPSPPPNAPAGPRAQLHSRGENLGKRKRGNETADARQLGRYDGADDGMVLHEWQASANTNPTPWLTFTDGDDLPGIALHKEIVDFYDWVKPKDYETDVRADVLKRLSLAFNRIEPGELKAFGSYAAGLYLPTGDMDLVYLQRSFRPGQVGPNGLPIPPARKLLQKFASFIRQQGIAKPYSVTLIASAKVPIIKFVEQASGLKVDLSFNNDTGLTANDTFQKWKASYPAMPVIVSIVKHYLMIRGLNDVSIGGLGGFSTICLVTSLIQHMHIAGSPPNLGQLLVEFFNLYGNLLDKDNVAIRLDPPGYIDKDSYKHNFIKNEKKERLTIIDPNRPENNISGGTHEIDRIIHCFSMAHDILQDRLALFQRSSTISLPFSFLKDLVGGDFSAYDAQRKILRHLHFGLTGRDVSAVIPPPPPPVSQRPVSPPQMNGAGMRNQYSGKSGARAGVQVSNEPAQNSNGAPTAAKKLTRAQRRANRMTTTRPDLEAKSRNS